jgi:hypothetical protein
MSRWFTICLFACLVLSCSVLAAQQVTYCEPYSDRFTLREEMLGKVGDYYWVSMITRKKVMRHAAGPLADNNDERSFVVYDNRMSPVNLIGNFSCPGDLLKEYMIAGQDHFDQLFLSGNGRKEVRVLLQRYDPDGRPAGPGRAVGRFPFNEPGGSFLLVRSEDRSRMLLVGFEFLPDGAPRMHTLLYDADWRLLSSRVYKHPFLTQPMIQDDEIGYPLEDFDNAPVKLANNGEWLMMSPSRTNKNYLLFHFDAADTAVACREIMLPAVAGTEDISLSIDNLQGGAVAGVLSDFHYSTLKNVRVVHYSMTLRAFDFDTSYRLTTLGGGKIRNDNMVKENFKAVPGRGFLLLKEYGRPFGEDAIETAFDDGWDPAVLFADNNIPDPASGPSASRIKVPAARYGYARYPAPVNVQWHDRGDLSLYYFPAAREDTCWSGMISQEQVTELNSPNLSYMIVPVQDKLFCLYNSFVHADNLYASTTVLNPKGQLITDQGILFWGLKNALDFQRARQVAPDQVVIPYSHFGKTGFAVVQFTDQVR